ncbi:hypothetical protein N7471_006978 [Penicillium samsonianum]|uniref:uncharacterized protein n=1 Tax=Penicillium samsonianum TaxID=1882272 RepID=UPI002548F126|nr:uncharacterized protein N7471_006978 [Penicillium samsonianum]KAJ6131763.1 hypothetical protein N7471_006978 [Penicillium samsonianum]
MPDANVWAAQYHRVDASYIKVQKGQTLTLPQLVLHPDVSRPGVTARQDDQVDAVTVQIQKPDSDTDESDQEDDAKYWDAFDMAERRMANHLNI